MSESNEIANREHDQIAGTKRVSLFPATSQRIVDTATTNIIYVGVAAAGLGQSTKGWLIEKVDTSVTNIITITHATDTWANRASANYS